MKKIINLILLLITLQTFCQVPELISFRAVAINSNGSLLTNQNISIKISIVDNLISPNEIYVESHSKLTDSNGAFNLNIGGGNFISGTNFNIINWFQGLKYLNVKIDPNNLTNYSVDLGTTQLLSVPFAFIAKNVVNGIETVNNLNDLRAINSLIDNKLIYLSGHTTVGDGGEGFFIYKSNLNINDNDGIIVKPISIISGSGRWIRQYSGNINVNFFGIKGGGIPSYSISDRIQNVIDFASSNSWYTNLSGMTIYFPNGQYFIDKPLILKDKVKIIGDNGTLFVANANSSYDYMIKIGTGPIVNCGIENLRLDTNNNSNLGGIHFKGAGNPTGGIWESKFKNININNLKGNGIYLEGGPKAPNYNIPNQFLTFENIRVTRSVDNYNSLKITGQNGQITFLNCTFDGAISKGTNVYIGIPNDGNIAPAVLSFINCTFQSSEYGVRLNSAENITFDNCWFEQLDVSLDVLDSKSINILNSRFADAAGFGSLTTTMIPVNTGRCINVKNSIITVENNYVTVTNPSSPDAQNEKFIYGAEDNNVINLKNNSFQDYRLGYTFGVMQTVLINSLTHNGINVSGVDISSKKIVFINNSGVINRINSTINSGELIFLRANGGSLTFNKLTNGTNGYNIHLNGRSNLVLTTGQAATFMKIDNVTGNGALAEKETYQLISVSN